MSEIGQTYNHLTIREIYIENERKMVLCDCSCGEKVRTRLSAVVHGTTLSCGHIRKIQKARNAQNKCWHREEQTQMDKTAAIQRFLTTYRVGGEL